MYHVDKENNHNLLLPVRAGNKIRVQVIQQPKPGGTLYTFWSDFNKI